MNIIYSRVRPLMRMKVPRLTNILYLACIELTELMRETASNTSIQTPMVMINLRPPTFSDPHLPTTHTEPPPSPSHTLSVTLSLSLSHSPQRLMQSVTNPECFPPIQTQREHKCCAERGVGGVYMWRWRWGGGGGAEEEGGLDVSWMCQSSPCP